MRDSLPRLIFLGGSVCVCVCLYVSVCHFQKSVRVMAKDLVRIRKHQQKFVNLTAQLRALSLQMQVCVCISLSVCVCVCVSSSLFLCVYVYCLHLSVIYASTVCTWFLVCVCVVSAQLRVVAILPPAGVFVFCP